MVSSPLGEIEREPGSLETESGVSRRFLVGRRAVRIVQAVLDAVALVSSFALAYLLRFDFQIPAAAFRGRSKAASSGGRHSGGDASGLRRLSVHLAVRRDGRDSHLRRRGGRVGVAAARSAPRAARAASSHGASRSRSSSWTRSSPSARSSRCASRAARSSNTARSASARAPSTGPERKPALLVGAGRAGVLAAREIVGAATSPGREGVRGRRPEKQGSVIHGFPVLGTTEDLPRLVRELGIAQVVITIAQISRREILRIIGICRKIPVKLRIIPGLYEVLQGKVQVTRIRNVQIEDLLGREPVYLDEAAARAVPGGHGRDGDGRRRLDRLGARPPGRAFQAGEAPARRAGGVRALRDRSGAAALVPAAGVVPLVADVGEEPRIRRIFEAHRPQVVLHAAAHKHVPMMEANPAEAIKNNILAHADCSASSPGEHGVEAFVMISTDKAVRPTSVMGATKRVAELVVQDLATALHDALRGGALRQRHRLGRLGRSDLPRADPPGRAGDRHASRRCAATS